MSLVSRFVNTTTGISHLQAKRAGLRWDGFVRIGPKWFTISSILTPKLYAISTKQAATRNTATARATSPALAVRPRTPPNARVQPPNKPRTHRAIGDTYFSAHINATDG